MMPTPFSVLYSISLLFLLIVCGSTVHSRWLAMPQTINYLILPAVIVVIYQVLLNDHIIHHIYCFSQINIVATQ